MTRDTKIPTPRAVVVPRGGVVQSCLLPTQAGQVLN